MIKLSSDIKVIHFDPYIEVGNIHVQRCLHQNLQYFLLVESIISSFPYPKSNIRTRIATFYLPFFLSLTLRSFFLFMKLLYPLLFVILHVRTHENKKTEVCNVSNLNWQQTSTTSWVWLYESSLPHLSTLTNWKNKAHKACQVSNFH